MIKTRSHAWTTVVLSRVLLVVAVTLGLCAMHVFAAAVSQHHVAASMVTDSTMVMDHSAPVSSSHASDATGVIASDHSHHSMADCVLFLNAGVVLLAALVTWAAARALRRFYGLPSLWAKSVMAITPWRGPPRWHWPRISLCVIRV